MLNNTTIPARINRHIVSVNATLRHALRCLNDLPGGSKTLLAVDDDGRLQGTVTDGDVRRAILAGASADSNVQCAMHTEFQALRHNDNPRLRVERLRQLRNLGITMIPVLDNNGVPSDIVNLATTRSLLPMQAILMAGGKGERLRPLTLTTPKPLLQVDGKAIIDYNVEALSACGITDITVCTRYLAEQIHRHFSKPVAGVNVRCVTEKQPMGTIGAATLVPQNPSFNDTLVMNSDLLTTIAFDDMFLHHTEHNADITIAVIPYQVSVPFALLNTDGDNVTGIAEKPSYSYFANAGIYIFRNSVLSTLNPDVRTDATDLITWAIDNNLRVTYHVINGTWIDVGSPADFRHAAELMRHHRNLLPQ